MPLIKIQGGTRSQNDKRLCDTCAAATILKGAADSAERIICNALGMRQVPFKVVECNRYYDSTQPSLYDLYQTAWVLKTSENRRAVGFAPWKEFSREHKDDHDVQRFGFNSGTPPRG